MSGILLSENDARRVANMVAWYERDRHNNPAYRRRSRSIGDEGGGAATGGEEIVAKVVQPIMYPDPSSSSYPNGRNYYTLRLASTTYGDWDDSGSTVYPVDAIVTYGDWAYKCREAIDPASSTPPDEDIYEEPGVGHWELLQEIRVTKALGITLPTGSDLRDCMPWCQKDSIVPIIQIGSDWYIKQTFTYVGTEQVKSLAWNEQLWRAMAVFK